MQVRYVEDLASHDDPESCVGGREAVGEALTGEDAGGAMSREKFSSGAPTLWREAEGNTGVARHGEVSPRLCVVIRPPARVEAICTGTGEIHRLAVRARPPGRSASARPMAPLR